MHPKLHISHSDSDRCVLSSGVVSILIRLRRSVIPISYPLEVKLSAPIISAFRERERFYYLFIGRSEGGFIFSPHLGHYSLFHWAHVSQTGGRWKSKLPSPRITFFSCPFLFISSPNYQPGGSRQALPYALNAQRVKRYYNSNRSSLRVYSWLITELHWAQASPTAVTFATRLGADSSSNQLGQAAAGARGFIGQMVWI